MAEGTLRRDKLITEKKISLELCWPPSINEYYTRTFGHVYIKKSVRDFRRSSTVNSGQHKGLFLESERLHVEIVLNAPNKRKFDIDNRVKGVLDALELSGVFPNDEQIDVLIVRRGTVIKGGATQVEIKVIP